MSATYSDSEFQRMYREVMVQPPEEDIWKLVFDVVSAESYFGTRHLIKQLEAARAGEWKPPRNSQTEQPENTEKPPPELKP